MSANMRATPPPSSSGRHGSTANVDASGTAIMSDSSIALKPVIDEPSNPMPPSNASSSWSELMLNDFSWPRMSVNHSRMKRIPRSSTSALTSSCVMRGRLGDPAIRPALELAQGRRELAPLLRELVLHAHRALAGDAALDDAARLEFLHALREQAVGEVGHRVRDLREAHGAAVQQDVEDRAGPAAADELDGLVQAWAAGRPRGGAGGHGAQAARRARCSSTEPSTGTSPATLIMAVKDSMARTAMASRSCSSLQPASRASSCRYSGWALRSASGRR